MLLSHVRGAVLCLGLLVIGVAGCSESDSVNGPDSAGTAASSDELFDLDDEGACVFSDASCLLLTEDECEDVNGVFLGIDSSCPGTDDPDCDCEYDHGDCHCDCDHHGDDHDCHCDGHDHDHDGDDHDHDDDCGDHDHDHDCDHDHCCHCDCDAVESCGLGFWKNHPGAWPSDIDSSDPLDAWFVFPDELDEFADDSLGDALRYPGGNGVSGGARLLLRDGVVALLNAAHSELNFVHDVDGVLDIVNVALQTGDRRSMQQARDRLKVDDEECPFD